MPKGTVKFFNDSMGFGFIVRDDGGKDIFVHKSGVERGINLEEGTKVEFEEKDDPRGKKAVNVSLA